MKCPQCGKDVIAFWDWGRGNNAFRHTCPHCLEQLKANSVTIKWFIGVMLWTMVVVALCIILRKHLEVAEAQFRSFLAPVLVLTVLPWVFLAWKKGGYISRQGKRERKENP
jgi:hypothetical protein